MINYGLIQSAINYYENLGFQRIESPWTVTKAVSDITRPENAREFQLVHDDNKVLVASGEQSFLYLYLKGFLPKGRFQTVTPCFRHDSFDSLHTKYFIKNELIITDKVNEENLDKMVEYAYEFFRKLIPSNKLYIDKKQDGSRDICYRPEYTTASMIELGSYGIRSCDFLDWIYGTGCAEPRLSSTFKKL